MKGAFITFEGIDGSGKTTIINIISKKLENAIVTAEPTNGWLGRAVEKAIAEGMDAITISLLFMADRREHVKKIKKWLEDGKIVLCDRYSDSTYAYQIEELKDIIKNPKKWIDAVHEPFYLKPDLTILLVLPVEEAMKRIGNRKRIIYERKDFLEKVQKNYMEMAKKEKRFIVIDAEKSKEEVARECMEAISKFLSLRRA